MPTVNKEFRMFGRDYHRGEEVPVAVWTELRERNRRALVAGKFVLDRPAPVPPPVKRRRGRPRKETV